MKFSPWILGAAALVPVAGAVTGRSMSTEPIGVHQDVTALLPDQPHAVTVNPVRQTHERLPDHYALETPEGRIEVSELAWHGRYREQMRERQYANFDDGYDVHADLVRMAARWDIDASTDRAAAALDAQQPHVVRYAEAPHYNAMQGARTGEVIGQPTAPPASAQPLPGNMRVVSLQSQPTATPRQIDVRATLALNE